MSNIKRKIIKIIKSPFYQVFFLAIISLVYTSYVVQYGDISSELKQLLPLLNGVLFLVFVVVLFIVVSRKPDFLFYKDEKDIQKEREEFEKLKEAIKRDKISKFNNDFNNKIRFK